MGEKHRLSSGLFILLKHQVRLARAERVKLLREV